MKFLYGEGPGSSGVPPYRYPWPKKPTKKKPKEKA